MPGRLRGAYLLLVALPALIFALAGIHTAQRNRARLVPELDIEAARRASAFLEHYRASFRADIDGPIDGLGARLRQREIERYAVYGPDGSELEVYPTADAALPLQPQTPRAAVLLAAARRGNAVVDLVRIDGEPVWLAYLSRGDTTAVAVRTADPGPVSRFHQLTGFAPALYLGRDLAMAVGSWPAELPPALADSLADLDRALTTAIDGEPIAAAPVKDFDDWDLIGAMAVRPSARSPAIPPLPWAPLAALPLSALLTALAVGLTVRRPASTERQTRRRHLRRGFTLALIPPALAAAWLAAADIRISSAATDALLELSADLVRGEIGVAVGDAPDVRQLADLTGADVARLQGDSIVGAAGVDLPAARLQGVEVPAGRIAVGDRVRAYRAVQLADGSRLLLFRTPREDTRKATFFWLAGLYLLLAAGILIFASLAGASSSRLELREATAAWAFVSPSLLLLLAFTAAPLLFALYLSFHGWNLLEPAKPFVGLQHYIELAGDGLFWNAAKNTALYSLYVPATMVCALGVAMLLNRSVRGVSLMRAIFFLPYITSFVAISIVWQWMYDPEFGLFNWALSLAGMGPAPWLSSPRTALVALMVMAVWIHIGFQMVIFLAGLQAIPNELYEAAMIDGAGPWRRFRRITLPLLRPTTFFVLVTSIIGSFQVFTFVYVMTEGGPLHATDVIVYHIYQNAWQFLRMGYASAMSWILFAVIFAITLLQFRFLGRRMTPS